MNFVNSDSIRKPEMLEALSDYYYTPAQAIGGSFYSDILFIPKRKTKSNSLLPITIY